MKKFISPKLMCLALIACAVPLSFAERYEKHEIYDYSDNTAREKPAKPVEVTHLEDIELPLRRISYSEFRDDFDRVVADGIRKDAKKLYEEQEAEKEVSSVEEIELPIYKKGGVYRYDYDYYSEPEKVVFYDGLGRKISDSIAKDAKRLYEKQEHSNEWTSWRSINVRDFWYEFWGLVKFAMYLVVLIFVGAFLWRKIKGSKR